MRRSLFIFFFFFNDTATTEIYTLSLHDALPISFVPLIIMALWIGLYPKPFFQILEQPVNQIVQTIHDNSNSNAPVNAQVAPTPSSRSEEHTSELQSLTNLVCRLLLEKKKKRDTAYQRSNEQPAQAYHPPGTVKTTRHIQTNIPRNYVHLALSAVCSTERVSDLVCGAS